MTRLACPACGRTTEASASRFCEGCGMPLVPEGDPATRSDAQQRARKITPAYAQGPLVKVAWARNQSEAELLAGMLLEEGVPSVVRRARGFDVPDFLAAGPRDVLVAAGGEDVAREVLGARSGTPGASASPTIRGVALAMLVIVLVSLVIAVAAAMVA